MSVYISLLRAINVGGHRKIKMNELRDLYESIGFEKVTSYIQSGNVVFVSPETDMEKLAHSIESNIQKTYEFDVDVMIRSITQFEELLFVNPFKGMDRDPYMLYITFFRKQLPSDKKQKLLDLSSEAEIFRFTNNELFSLINKKTGKKEMFSTNFVEKVIGIPGTTRNWNSVNRILELAKTL